MPSSALDLPFDPSIPNFFDLPTEIWFQIAQYLSESQLFQLKSFNSFFLNCWMDHRWKAIEINNRMAGLLVQRMADPLVATRTKKLTICLEPPRHSVPLPSLFRTITSPSVARMLRELSLTGHAEMFDLLGEYSAHNTFENLTTLSLNLYSLTQTKISPALEPFLRSFSALQFLSIETTLNPCPLFEALFQSDSSHHFPSLKSLHLALYISPPFPFFFHSLRRFLLSHAHHLQFLHLYLRVIWRCPAFTEELSLGAWLANLVDNNSQFPSLRILDIYPSITHAGLNALLALVKRAPILSSLHILTREFTLEEATQLVNTLAEAETPRKLKKLDISLTYLSVPFLDLLARKLPQLEELCLEVDMIIDSDQCSFYKILRQRQYNPQDVLYSWQLHSLSITKNGEVHKKLLHAITSVVPNLACKTGCKLR